jgi:hypothetical protein
VEVGVLLVEVGVLLVEVGVLLVEVGVLFVLVKWSRAGVSVLLWSRPGC